MRIMKEDVPAKERGASGVPKKKLATALSGPFDNVDAFFDAAAAAVGGGKVVVNPILYNQFKLTVAEDEKITNPQQLTNRYRKYAAKKMVEA